MVIIQPPEPSPGVSLEWLEGDTAYQLVSELPREQTLRVYHSIVTGASDCGDPREG